jgi:hypothetical protein
MHVTIGLFFDGFHHFGVPVADVADGYARYQIEVFFPVLIEQVYTLCSFNL